MTVKGLFITIEGIDGCGKTTQARLLVEWLHARGRPVLATREPGGTPPGERLRALVLAPDEIVPSEAELFLYLADRSFHIANAVRPALEKGEVVVCERHADSTLAYQGYGRGIDVELLRRLNIMATGGLIPDLTLVLDITPEQARLDEKRLDRLESEGRDFVERVVAGFRELARAEPKRIKLIDGSIEIGAVHEKVVAAVQELLVRHSPPDTVDREGP